MTNDLNAIYRLYIESRHQDDFKVSIVNARGVTVRDLHDSVYEDDISQEEVRVFIVGGGRRIPAVISAISTSTDGNAVIKVTNRENYQEFSDGGDYSTFSGLMNKLSEFREGSNIIFHMFFITPNGQEIVKSYRSLTVEHEPDSPINLLIHF